ncbi:MAG: tetratricopeptide repeat protein [Prevotellaceae bacterium]|nr:tetratricopeptide repeat protein [Prevotellaceae bacterium]
MRQTILLLLLSCSIATVCAASVLEADSAYANGDFARAAECYAAAQKETPAAELLYNLGNCYYRMGRKAEAVLCYRRALRMDSSLEDARFNLALVDSQLEDRFNERDEMFFVSALRNLADCRSARSWAWTGFGWMVLAAAAFLICCAVRRTAVRKVALAVTAGLMFVSLACDGFAIYRRAADNVRQAVVMRTANIWKSAETTGERLRTLHEGTVVKVLEAFGGGMLRVEMPDGTVGFVARKDVENV